jgi:hypothetical protein
VLAPGQVHHWDGVRDLDGFVVLFTDDFSSTLHRGTIVGAPIA